MFIIEIVPTELEDISQFLENGLAQEGMSAKNKKILAMKVAPYSLINGFLYKLGLDEVLRRCILEHERENIMHESHYGQLEDISSLTRLLKRSNSQDYGG